MVIKNLASPGNQAIKLNANQLIGFYPIRASTPVPFIKQSTIMGKRLQTNSRNYGILWNVLQLRFRGFLKNVKNRLTGGQLGTLYQIQEFEGFS